MNNQIMYTGKHSEYQTQGNRLKDKKYVLIEYTILNSVQTFLYNRALFGLSVYEKEEIEKMHWEKRKRIIKVHKRAQGALNVMKQVITNKINSKIITNLFPKSTFAQDFAGDVEETDSEFINKLSFKQLGISKRSVIDKLIAEGILPTNFYQLKDEVCKPSSY